MLSRVLAMALCPSVCVCHKSKRLNESGWFLARELPSTYPTLCHKEIQVPSKIMVLPNFPLELFFINSGLKKFRHSISIVEACYQLFSRKVDAQNVIN